MSSIDRRLRKDNALRPVIPWWTVIFHLSCGSRVCYKLLLSLENVFPITGNKSCRYLLGLAAVGDMAAACWSCWLFTMVTNQRLQIFLRPYIRSSGDMNYFITSCQLTIYDPRPRAQVINCELPLSDKVIHITRLSTFALTHWGLGQNGCHFPDDIFKCIWQCLNFD